MKHDQKQNVCVAVAAGSILLFLDFFSKAWAASPFFKPAVLVRNYFYFTLHTNNGIAFGIPIPLIVQILASAVIISLLVKIGWGFIGAGKKRQCLRSALLGVIIGGAVGNLADRVFFGYVIDFIALKPFPVFNVADIGITVGLVLLFGLLLVDPK
ncbi:signal peptidase II [Candidatus Peregrinibacteria bacterium]|nr:signal peptidase II [Candidatus Peregrinibacteria bacterium]